MRRRLFALVLVLAITLCTAAFAEDCQTYSDELYRFDYPSGWMLQKANNGDIVIASPNGVNGIITFALNTNLFRFVDENGPITAAIESVINQYNGANLSLDGNYELISAGSLQGFRAEGKWTATGHDAVMLILAGENRLIGFVLVAGAVTLEHMVLDSVTPLYEEQTAAEDGLLAWSCPQFSMRYPEQYGLMEQSAGVVFMDPQSPNNLIMARAYSLDFTYSDSMAPVIAASKLPQSTHVEAEPVMEQVGDRQVAVIRGELDAGPLSFYVLGNGQTAVAVMFTGAECVQLAEKILMTVEIK